MSARLATTACVLALALAACGGGGGGGSDEQAGPVELRPANPSAGCGAVTRYPDDGRKHVPRGTKVSYRTLPPTSGNHLQIWGATGTYAQEIPDEMQVHNLEHGHVAIQYVPGVISSELLAGLVDLARKNARWVLLAPRSADRFDPPAALAFTAWRTGQACATPTVSALAEARAFIDRYGREAPEEIAGEPVRETPPSSPLPAASSPSP